MDWFIPISVWKGILLGLGAAVPIGPVNVEMARRALKRGPLFGAVLGLGAVNVDVLYAVLCAIGLRPFYDIPWVKWPLTVAGVGLLLYLGISCLRAAARADSADWGETGSPEPLWRGYLTGLLMTFLNPMTLVFWFSVVPTQAGNEGVRSLPSVCLGVFLGTSSWCIGFSNLVGRLGSRNKGAWMRWADRIGGVILLAFAAWAIFGSARALL